MNRTEKRTFIRNIKKAKEIQHNSTKGAFGRPPQHVMDDRLRKFEQKARKFIEKEEQKQEQNSESKPVLAENCQKVTVSDQNEVK